jgi:hypothetical protein
VPLWIRAIAARKSNENHSLEEITPIHIRDYFDDVYLVLQRFRITPKTRQPVLASYLAGQPCGTVSGLADFAGISFTTARVWLEKCVDYEILRCFRTDHETFYLQPKLLALVLKGQRDNLGNFMDEFDRDLRTLQEMKRWLSDSRITSKLT